MSEVTQSSNYKGFQYYRQLSLDRDEEESEWKFDVNVCQGRQMRISLPKTDSIIPSDWMHFKLSYGYWQTATTTIAGTQSIRITQLACRS